MKYTINDFIREIKEVKLQIVAFGFLLIWLKIIISFDIDDVNMPVMYIFLLSIIISLICYVSYSLIAQLKLTFKRIKIIINDIMFISLIIFLILMILNYTISKQVYLTATIMEAKQGMRKLMILSILTNENEKIKLSIKGGLWYSSGSEIHLKLYKGLFGYYHGNKVGIIKVNEHNSTN